MQTKTYIFLVSALILSSSSWAQIFTDSNLPIVIINPEQSIRDEVRVAANMKIIYRGPGQRNYMTDQHDTTILNYNGRINIEIRGSSSQATNKKQYALTTMMPDDITKNNVKLLGLPKENDWILNGMVFDPARIRDYLCYNLSRKIGEYASRTVYCEVVIDGVYLGLYVLQERIKADDNRVDIVKMQTIDNFLPNLSGGYITKADKTTGGDPVAWTMYTWYNAEVNYIHVAPKPEEITSQQNSYIYQRFAKLSATALANNISPIDGYPSIIDIPSFIDYMIISELSSNADAYMFSTYFHKDRNGKLRAGPVWDCDLTFGYDLYFWGFDRSKTDIWQFSNYDNDGARFWRDLFYNEKFKCYLSRRWHELTQPGQPLSKSSINAFIDETVSSIREAVNRDIALWNLTSNYDHEIQKIKEFADQRINWISNNIGSFGGCTSPDVPSLVISKIMYHPDTISFSQSDEQEFIEIVNNSDEIVDLTGIYFTGTGFVYQFPPNTTIDRRQALVIAANASIFEVNNGGTPFGEFTRHLSNKSQRLVLADAFGNVIDSLTYSDTIPWPDADGNGYYLNLTDAGLDNSIASNWTAANKVVVAAEVNHSDQFVLVFPNPVRDILNIQCGTTVQSVSVSDIHGRLLMARDENSDFIQLDLSSLQPGTYIIQVITDNRTHNRKIIRQ